MGTSCNADEEASNIGELEEANGDYHSRLRSEYFKTRPSMLKIMWRSNDLTLEEVSNLPQGWRTKVYKRKSGRLDIHYITPENLDIRSKFGVLEYMRLSENYDKEGLDRVANNLRYDVR